MTLRAAVAARANYSSEYCRLREEDDTYSFHVEHIVALKHDGSDDLENLALACQHCNLHKGSNLSGIDPVSGAIVELFHPRRDAWDDHFGSDGPRFFGRTPIGRATIRVLAMNDPDRVSMRAMLGVRGNE